MLVQVRIALSSGCGMLWEASEISLRRIQSREHLSSKLLIQELIYVNPVLYTIA